MSQFLPALKGLTKLDFLINAFCDDVTQQLLGMSCVEFDLDMYASRARVRMYSADEFSAAYDSMTPMGFVLDKDGLLSADSNALRVVSGDTFPFIYEQCSKVPAKEFDITDLILFGAENSGATLVNYSAVKEGEEPITLPFSSYKVSGSSMNIYGAYRLPDGSFRTHSMLEMEDGSGKTVYCIFPKGRLGSEFSGFCEEIDTIEVRGVPMVVFKVDTTMKCYSVGIGEAFLNYLAYMVAYYNIGRKVLRVLAPAVESTQEKALPPQAERGARKVRKNVSIIHAYDREFVKDVVECSNDSVRLNNLVSAFPESRVTIHWVQKAYNSPWIDRSKEDNGISTVCANLAVECRKQGLKYGLELLTHRCQLMATMTFDNSIPLILRGGGVDGQSAKRVSF